MTDTATPSVPLATSDPNGPMQRLNVFLDKHVLPYPVKYLTNRITILGTLSLLVPLIILANVTVFVLLANSYLNVMSVVVSSTVLLYSTLSEARDKAAAQRREEIAATHDKQIETRAEADHQRLQEIHDHLDEVHTEVMQHINTSLDNIQKILVERLQTIQMEDHAHITETHTAINASITAHREELVDLHALLDSLRVSIPAASNGQAASTPESAAG